MRTLLIYKEFPGVSPSGGIGTYAAILSRALVAKGVDLHVLCVDPGLPHDRVPMDGFTLHTSPYRQIRGIGKVARLPATVGRLSHAASVWRGYRRSGVTFDVIEAPELYAESLFVGLRGGPPLVVRMHSSAAQLFPYLGIRGADARLTIALEHAAVRRAQIVVSTAPNLKRAIIDLDLDPAFTRPIIYPILVRPATPPVGGPPIILFVGRLETLKDPETLLRAAPAVLRTIPDARFRFVGPDTSAPGSPSHRQRLERLADQLRIRGCVEFVGAVPHEGVFDEMARATICAFPSKQETFGNVVAEAASIGRPVLVSDIPAFTDFVSDGVTGRVAPVGNAAAWADGLIRGLQAPAETAEMASRLRQSIIERADPSVVAQLTIDAHTAAIERWRAAR